MAKKYPEVYAVFQKLKLCNCFCSLKLCGSSIGWIGAVYRTVAALSISIEIENLTNNGLILDFLIGGLVYVLISLAAVFLYIVAIQKNNSYQLLPYSAVLIFEFVCGVALFLGGTIFLIRTKQLQWLPYFVPIFVLILIVYLLFLVCTLQLFQNFKKTAGIYVESAALFNDSSFICLWSCCKSASLDIATTI